MNISALNLISLMGKVNTTEYISNMCPGRVAVVVDVDINVGISPLCLVMVVPLDFSSLRLWYTKPDSNTIHPFITHI